VWPTDWIVRIDPVSGRVVGRVDLTGLLAPHERRGTEDVANGIAYDASGDRLFLTGKLWPRLYEGRLPRPEPRAGATWPLLHPTIAGSLPKPAWLADPETLWAPWRLSSETLADGQRDAVLIALKLQEAAGIDIVTDGEQSRQHFVHGFLARLDGIDFGKRV